MGYLLKYLTHSYPLASAAKKLQGSDGGDDDKRKTEKEKLKSEEEL